MKIHTLTAALFATGSIFNVVHAGGTIYPQLAPIYVKADQQDQFGLTNTATQGTITKEHLANRPLLRPAEVLETIPGVIVTQHSGDGKANQYFLRGFNLDHGTDFATSVDGIPINMVTHAHGQGYTDLNFLIPELIDNLTYHKGATDITDGDFASAGTAKIRTISAIEQPFVQMTLGSNDYRRILTAGSTEFAGGILLGAFEGMSNDGPWDYPEDLEKQNYLLKYSQGNQNNGWNFMFNHYQSNWNSTDQVAQRAVSSDLIGRYGSLDPSDGGKTTRTAFSLEKNSSDDVHQTRLNLYGVHSKLNLFSNFTYYLVDPIHGDQFEQAENRKILGGSINHNWNAKWLGLDMINTMGTSFRYDDIDGLGLYQTENRQRFNTIREDHVKELSLGVWVQNQTQWTPWLKSIAGLRADYFNFDVHSDLAANSGKTDDHILSPKISFVFGPWTNTEYYLNYGYGFHSNDARGTTIHLNPDPRDEGYMEPVQSVSPLVRTKNAELGIRGEWISNLTTTLAFWQLDSDSELVFVGDAGTTEASRPSRRQGIELSHFYKPNSDWLVDVDMAWSKARYKDDASEGNYIPGAINTTASAGINYTPSKPWSLGVRMRYFGPRPLVEDNSVKSSSSTLVNLQSTYRFNKNLQAQIDILNLFNRQVNDIEYLYESCLRTEQTTSECNALTPTREGIIDKHIHPAEDRAYRFSVKYSF
ncbi:TonB-dependent receptor [Acinetobacter baumannii]|uniref:TonB-dependent receptor n=2 Tax=Gammaproteobacteria TaxID=1236 RepID=UPI001057A202|nr:TonB-dependent receptor [Acinetobacter baumannii]MCY3197912.1 TonB-dependent receptor [Acinetobacter baumannii]MCZ3010245.1 TonB-dependent receptor [Acinetobacter baumannii]MDC4436971.1 TonB-dependent receptor [Acinetobacter baumannii]MDC4478218.1 TonB-dependent receptor [Acinetobacter baumannii]MDC4643552.1 TonB-dependent receptor [Acinetobacter baumannii]